jgi:hypothetical protein
MSGAAAHPLLAQLGPALGYEQEQNRLATISHFGL